MIKAEVIADSKNRFGNRITTMVVTFPRIILAEFNTHRMFSRNSASSRAIPLRKMVESIRNNPFIPIAWQKDHSGMQGSEYLQYEQDNETLKRQWLLARDYALESAGRLWDNQVTKQLCNRLLEPFMWHTVIVTATEWENFFALRCPSYHYRNYPEPDGFDQYFRSKKDLIKITGIKTDRSEIEWLKANKGQAEIHMMALAEAMWDAYNESTPKELNDGEWHIPFGDKIPDNINTLLEDFRLDDNGLTYKDPCAAIKIATARCARVSYTVVGEEGKPDNYENDIKLHDRLAKAGHMSPFEHCAKSPHGTDKESDGEFSGNFRGFIQYRKMLPNENIITK